jgi:tetratricopeptide (TPR) repeat protein
MNRVAEADVPVGAKFVNCGTCKSRVPLPAQHKGPTAIPTIAGGGPPFSSPGSGGAPKPTPSRTEQIGLADLPMPKRGSALGGDVSKPAPRSGLSTAIETTGLPAPRDARPGRTPQPTPGPIELDDFLSPPPEPAPRAQAAPKPAAIADLPAPKARAKPELSDLPAPRPPAAAATLPDMPAPKQRAKSAIDFDDPTTPKIKGIVDLPAPKPKAGVTDLPGPRGVPSGIVDLPAPKATSKGTAAPRQPDLPAPRPHAGPPPLTTKIPAAKPQSGELPAPKLANPELPAPKGFFDDLPQVARGGPAAPPPPAQSTELPAPKGFFDDLPQVAPPRAAPPPPQPGSTELPAPKGFFDDLPQPASAQHQGASELPAPKGFFEDLPQPALSGQPSQLPAPKGFFEDLPGRPNVAKPEVPAPKGFFEDLPGRPNVAKPEVPAPKGFFEDLPGRPNVAKPEVPAPKGFFEDLPGRVNAATPQAPAPKPTDEAIDLSLEDQAAEAGGQFDDLDLSVPTPKPGSQQAGDGSPIRIRTPSGGADARSAAGRATVPPLGKTPELALELDPAHSAKLQRRQVEPQIVKTKYKEARVPGRGRKVVMIVLLVLAAAGGGGFYLFQKYQAKQQRSEEIDKELNKARAAMTAADPGHWARAASATRKVLELDPEQPAALGIGAEAQLASWLADGTIGATNKAKKLLLTAKEADLKGPEIQRARALQQVANGQADQALPALQALATAAPTDAALQLYLGWANAQTGNTPEAVKAFDRAMQSPPLKIAALYGRARAKLAQVELDGARADFAAVLEQAKDHIGAQVGLAAALPAAQAAQQEADVLAILQRKDLATADPRAVTQAWVLAAEAARRSNRLDVARERYKKALAVLPSDVAALSGAADVELRDGKIDAASDLVNKATTEAPNDMRAQLLAAQLEIARGQLEGAAKRLDLLGARQPPPPALDRARLKLVTGKMLEARGDDVAAVEAYADAAKLAGDLDLAPLLAAVTKLTALAAKADEGKDTAKANALRARADSLLGSIAQNAQKDAQLALTLGIAYLQVGAADKAEPWLRQAVDARPNDADAHYQLAKALGSLGRNDEAIASLRRATEIDPAREEFGIELARRYEASGRNNDAEAQYTRLLAGKDPSLELRARAGRFFARIEKPDKAAEQGEKILAVDPSSPAGYFLKAEGLLAKGELDAARKLYQLAADAEKDPQYLDGLGRVAFRLSDKDVKYQDTALRAYIAAAELDPTMFNPQLGMGMLHIARHEFEQAVKPLLAAYKIKDTALGALLLGRAYKEISQVKVATEWYEHSLKLEPSSVAYFNLGLIYFDANQGAKAAAALANATKRGFDEEKQMGMVVPWLTEALYYQGRVNSDLHNDSGARDAWEKFVARNPPNDARLQEARQKLATELRRR